MLPAWHLLGDNASLFFRLLPAALPLLAFLLKFVFLNQIVPFQL